MRATLLILVLLACAGRLEAVRAGDGVDAEDAFHAGNAAFQQGDYASAIHIYEDLMAQGYRSGALYYNLGNAYYRSGKISAAILNYERARHWIPKDEDLAHNLEVSRLALVDQIEPVPRLILWNYWDSFRDSLSMEVLTAIGYLAYLAALCCIALILLSEGPSARRRGLAGVVGAVLVLGAAVLLLDAKVSGLKDRDFGIIITPVVEVKNAPDSEGPSAFVLHEGTKLRVTDQVGTWIQIRLADGKVGWLQADSVEII
jgi:tetratricopeptide (TPR) repeat protein